MNESLKNNIETLFGKMENLVSSKTVIGEPVHIGDVKIIPLVEVTFGIGAAAGGESNEKKEKSGGGAVGGKITPVGVLAVINGTVQLIDVKNQDSVNKLIDLVPGILSKFNLDKIFGKKDGE